MPEQQIDPRLPFNVGAAVARANAVGWMEMGREFVHQTLDTIDLSFEFGRRMAACRSMTEVWETEADIGRRAIEAALERSRNFADVGLAVTRDVAQELSERANAAKEARTRETAQAVAEARAAGDGEARASDAERSAPREPRRPAVSDRPRQQGQAAPSRPSIKRHRDYDHQARRDGDDEAPSPRPSPI